MSVSVCEATEQKNIPLMFCKLRSIPMCVFFTFYFAAIEVCMQILCDFSLSLFLFFTHNLYHCTKLPNVEERYSDTFRSFIFYKWKNAFSWLYRPSSVVNTITAFASERSVESS